MSSSSTAFVHVELHENEELSFDETALAATSRRVCILDNDAPRHITPSKEGL